MSEHNGALPLTNFRQSTSVAALAAALAKAQGEQNRHAEAELIGRLYPPGRHLGNQHDSLSLAARFFSKIAFGACDCWYWVGARNHLGYGETASGKAHRVSWELHHGPIPEGMHILHRCDVRCCVNPGHLFLGTHADNMRDMAGKGRGATPDVRGERNPQAKLTAAEVEAMREARQITGATYRTIARWFGVNTMTAHRAINGATWGDKR